MDQSERFGIVKGGVADSVFVNSKVLMKKDSNFTLRIVQIIYANLTEENIFMARNRVVADYFHAKRLVPKSYICNKRFLKIFQAANPIIRKHP